MLLSGRLYFGTLAPSPRGLFFASTGTREREGGPQLRAGGWGDGALLGSLGLGATSADSFTPHRSDQCGPTELTVNAHRGTAGWPGDATAPGVPLGPFSGCQRGSDGLVPVEVMRRRRGAVCRWTRRKSRVSIRRQLGMHKCKRRIETRLRGRQSVTGSPRQGANMVTDPCENIVRKHGYQSRPPGTETIIIAIMARKAARAVRKKMASAPAVIGLVRKFAGNQLADHVADCLIPLDGAYARARSGSQYGDRSV